MQSLKEMREKYLASQEAARKAEQDKVILELEKQAKKIDVKACRDAFTKAYVETGRFTNPVPEECTTKWHPIDDYYKWKTTGKRFNKEQSKFILEVDCAYDCQPAGYRVHLNPENMFQ